MPDAANHTVTNILRNNERLLIRSFLPEDRPHLLAALGQVSGTTFYRRFFGPKRQLREEEIAFFSNVDFINHVALVAVIDRDRQSTIIGAARYIVVGQGKAEIALAVSDKYQGLGIGSALVRELACIARGAGLHELVAEVLIENVAMLKIFDRSGFEVTKEADMGNVRVTLHLG